MKELTCFIVLWLLVRGFMELDRDSLYRVLCTSYLRHYVFSNTWDACLPTLLSHCSGKCLPQKWLYLTSLQSFSLVNIVNSAFLTHWVGSAVCFVGLTISVHVNSQGWVFLTGAVVSGYLPQKTDAENHHEADVLWSHKAAGYWGLVQWHQSTNHETVTQYCFGDRWLLFFKFCER